MIRTNYKGFTLVELLAIMTILSLILMITFTTISSLVTNSKDKLQETQKKQILRSAELYNNKEGLYDYDTCVNLETLEEKGYIKEDDLKDPKTGESLNGSVKIYHEINKYSYEYSDKACLCKKIDNKGDYDIGTKYSCEVKDGTKYNFYILSKNDDASVNLIMDRNICADGTIPTDENSCSCAWHAGVNDNNYGPDTAMTNLYRGTKDWTNIPDMIMNYEDERNKNDNLKGYQSIITNKNTMVTTITGKQNKISESQTFGNIDEPLKARLPREDEVTSDEVGCHISGGNEGVDFGSCPEWLIENMAYYDVSSYAGSGYTDKYSMNKGNGITSLAGYWLLATCSTSTSAHFVANYGVVNDHGVDYAVADGVRAVITVSKYDLSK